MGMIPDLPVSLQPVAWCLAHSRSSVNFTERPSGIASNPKTNSLAAPHTMLSQLLLLPNIMKMARKLL